MPYSFGRQSPRSMGLEQTPFYIAYRHIAYGHIAYGQMATDQDYQPLWLGERGLSTRVKSKPDEDVVFYILGAQT